MEDAPRFFFGEHGGDAFGFIGADGVEAALDFNFQDVPIEEQDRAESLVLGGGREALFFCEAGLKGFNLRKSNVFGVEGSGAALQVGVKEVDVFLNPKYVGFSGALGIMLEADGVTHLVEEFSSLGRLGVHTIPFLG